MRLSEISVKNFRSICVLEKTRIEPLQGLVGGNGNGKSNLLRAVQCFLTSGAGGMKIGDFNDPGRRAIIECEFSGLSDSERRELAQYLLGDRIILRKELWIATDEEKGRSTVKAEYHGYQAEPQEVHLSIKKIEEQHSPRPKWREIAESAGIVEYVQAENGNVTKHSYQVGLARYLAEHDVAYDRPELGETQALGIAQNLLSKLPRFYLLPAITDYSDEIDKRSSSTVFRQLMGDLASRIMRADPRYCELEEALARVRALLNNPESEEDSPGRLAAIGGVEEALCDQIKKVMPTVQSVHVGVEVEETRDIFSKGVNIKINDGAVTDVLDKGHGMQRCLVFSLLQMLISSVRGDIPAEATPIILAIEEPELYIHPHSKRLIFNVLKEFAGVAGDGEPKGTDQVIYTTHSPAFIDVWNYHRIGVVQKPDGATGTVVRQAPAGVIGNTTERKTFQLLTSFGLKHNEMFFARDIIIVEGPEDEIGIIATARKLGRIKDLLDEIDVSVVVANGKGEVPKFQKMLNAFGLSYGVLLELDGKPETDAQNSAILSNLNGNRTAKVPRRIEDVLGVGHHFKDQYEAMIYFSDSTKINSAFEQIVTNLLPPVVSESAPAPTPTDTPSSEEVAAAPASSG